MTRFCFGNGVASDKICDAMESCRKCEAILLEYRRTYRDFWLNASPETRNVYQSVANLIGGTEEDVIRLEVLVPPFRTASAEQLSMEYRREGGPYQGTQILNG